jgi:hypothetical protein
MKARAHLHAIIEKGAVLFALARWRDYDVAQALTQLRLGAQACQDFATLSREGEREVYLAVALLVALDPGSRSLPLAWPG